MTDYNIKVSICIPIYGVEQYIERCARSILEQTYSNIEYVFVNDCTKDRSIEILTNTINDYPEKISSIKIISHKNNRGLAATRNTAIDNCSGDFVMHVDSDDYVEKDAVEVLINKQLETNADIVSGNAYKETLNDIVLLTEPDYTDKDEMILNCIKPKLDHVIWRRLIRLSLYKDHKISAKEGVNVGEDWQVLPQLIYYSKRIAKVNKIIYHYNCMNEESYMNRRKKCFNKNIVFQDIQSLNILEDFFKDKDLKFRQRLLEIKGGFLERHLTSAYKSKDANSYNIIAKMILKLDDIYLQKIGWNKFRIRLINMNYLNRKVFDVFYNITH